MSNLLKLRWLLYDVKTSGRAWTLRRPDARCADHGIISLGFRTPALRRRSCGIDTGIIVSIRRARFRYRRFSHVARSYVTVRRARIGDLSRMQGRFCARQFLASVGYEEVPVAIFASFERGFLSCRDCQRGSA
jgi:hypothetical protein